MRICEYVRELLYSCAALDGEVVAVGFFDEKLGAAAVLPDGGERVLRNYADGGCLACESVRIVFAHDGGTGEKAENASYEKAQIVCDWLNARSNTQKLPEYGLYTVSEVCCENAVVSGNVGVRKTELKSTVKYIKGKD